MKTYELTQDWNGVPQGTQIFGPYQITGSSTKGYFTKENIPTTPQGGTNAFFASAVEGNDSIFRDVTTPETKNPA